MSNKTTRTIIIFSLVGTALMAAYDIASNVSPLYSFVIRLLVSLLILGLSLSLALKYLKREQAGEINFKMALSTSLLISLALALFDVISLFIKYRATPSLVFYPFTFALKLVFSSILSVLISLAFRGTNEPEKRKDAGALDANLD